MQETFHPLDFFVNRHDTLSDEDRHKQMFGDQAAGMCFHDTMKETRQKLSSMNIILGLFTRKEWMGGFACLVLLLHNILVILGNL